MTKEQRQELRARVIAHRGNDYFPELVDDVIVSLLDSLDALERERDELRELLLKAERYCKVVGNMPAMRLAKEIDLALALPTTPEPSP